MLICHCNGVSDRAIRKAVRRGASSAAQVGSMTGAGTCCGGCLDAVNDIVHSEAGGTHEKAAPADIVSLQLVSS
jgi:nitrite reductase (NADH) large subunit